MKNISRYFCVIILLFILLISCKNQINKVATPVFSPDSGTFILSKEIRISCATEGATIYYTLDGTIPDTSSFKYNSPILINSSTTIKAYAVKDGMEDSDTASASYTINDYINSIWTKFLGTENNEIISDLIIDNSGNIYIVGTADGDIMDQTNNGGSDILLAKFDADGLLLWVRLIGGAGNDGGSAITLDPEGNIYITGWTLSSFNSQINNGGSDFFIVKYQSNGNYLWTRIFGGSSQDSGYDIQIDQYGYLYVVGDTNSTFPSYSENNKGATDAFVVKYYSDGGVFQWIKLIGDTNNDYARAIAINGSTLFVAGYTYSSFGGQLNNGGQDAFVVELGNDKTYHWTKFIGSTEDDKAIDIIYKDYIYITGYTSSSFDGNTNQGLKDAFISKLQGGGSPAVIWTKFVGSSGWDEAYKINIDDNNYIYIVGKTDGYLNNQVNSGYYDAFIVKIDANNEIIFTRLIGSQQDDDAIAIIISGTNIYIAGTTQGSFDEQINNGGKDIFIKKYFQ